MSGAASVAQGFAHFTVLAGLILLYCRRMDLPWREWPLIVFVLLWTVLVAAGYLVSPFDALGSLPAYVAASFAALGLVLFLHRAASAPPRKTPFAGPPKLPAFVTFEAPGLRRRLWWFLAGTLAAALLINLVVCFGFYPVNADSLNYRLPRVFWYVSHGNLLHPFVSEDKRLTFYPLNGTLLYVPLALHGVSSVFYGLPSLFSWLAVGCATYRFARALRAERLVALFAAWLVAMTPGILVQATSTSDEILAAACLLAGLFFAWRWLVSGAGHYLLLAALGAGLSIGTKLHIFFLIPVVVLGLVWFGWFLHRRRESWRRWLPQTRVSAAAVSLGAFLATGPMFLVLNYISSGQFYFLGETAEQVLNLGASLQVMGQNFLIYLTQMLLTPVADLNFWQGPDARAAANRALNDLFTPLILPFVGDDPRFYHLSYRFLGVIPPTAAFLTEYGLWPGFVWLLWLLQARALAQARFSLRPLFVLLAATPVVWFAVWPCVTLYMEGAPAYFAFYLMCAAPAAVFAFARATSPRSGRIRWAVVAFVAATSLIIDANVYVNNVFRGLRVLAAAESWPYDWLEFRQPVVDEIKRAKNIQIALTHGKVYHFSFMRWNPRAHYYGPYAPAPDPANVLHILSTPSEYKYGFMPVKIAGKPTPGITYLGRIRGVDREEIFAFGNGVERRHPDRSDYISLHARIRPDGGKYGIAVDRAVAGLNPGDMLEFKYEIRAPDGSAAYRRPWSRDPAFAAAVPRDPTKFPYTLIVSMRPALKNGPAASFSYPLAGEGAWKLPGESGAGYDE